MLWSRKFILLLFPTIRIKPSWLFAWEERERVACVATMRASHFLSILAYTAHVLFIDNIYHLEPRSQWVFLRSVGIAINVVGVILSYIPAFTSSRYMRWGAFVAGLVCAYIQGVSMVWFRGTPYIYAAIIPSFGALALRTSVLNSWLFMFIGFGLQMHAWFLRPDEMANILSACSIAIIFVSALRSRMSLDVNAFISAQENLEAQKKLIQAEIELNDQIKAFLPKEIFKRLTHLIKSQNLTPLTAMTEVLRCRRRSVTCLHTDIRGFTQKTKHVQAFVENAALPDIKACTDLVEKYSGIPKLIGDLVFAYFDGPPEDDFLRAILCAFELIGRNTDLNAHLPEEQRVKRFVLLSFGEALVGNIGGTDSSRDVNVLGTPANILSRIDPLTKDERVGIALRNQSILVTRPAGEFLKRLVPQAECYAIDLKQLEIKIRDFEEETGLFVIVRSQENEILIRAALRSLPTPIASTNNHLNLPEVTEKVA